MRDSDLPLVVLGGLVPEVLTSGQGVMVPPHLGTVDVDVLVDLHVDPNAGLSAVETALGRLGFSLRPSTPPGWRWHVRVGNAQVRLDFLCDLEDQPGGATIRPLDCTDLHPLNLRGTGFVALDWSWHELSGQLPDGIIVSLRARFAGLSGYLLAKATALSERGEEKDYYDFVYVLIYNRAGGPSHAARALQAGPLAPRVDALTTVWREVSARFQAPGEIGPVSYAAQALLVNPPDDRGRLRHDAVAAVAGFLATLNVPAS